MPEAAYGASFVYVTNAGSGNVSVIDMATNAVITTVTVGLTPEQVAVTPNGAFAYVAKSDGSDPGSVSVIATASNTVAGSPIPVDVAPVGVAITPNGAFVYVANSGSNTVSVIATASNTVVATVPVGSGPAGVAITPDGAFVYVSNFASNPGSVSVIATATNTVTATISVEERPDFLAVSLNGAFVFVPNQNSNTVSVIATATNTVTATIPVGPLGAQPTGVATTPPNIPNIPTLSDGVLLFLIAAMAAVLALRIVKRQASPLPHPPRAI
jgi:YVTN family beta-propeller protein